MNWYCGYKSQEEGYILTEIPQWRVLAGTEFWTCDPPTQIFFDLHSYIFFNCSFLVASSSQPRTISFVTSSFNPTLALKNYNDEATFCQSAAVKFQLIGNKKHKLIESSWSQVVNLMSWVDWVVVTNPIRSNIFYFLQKIFPHLFPL